MVHPPRRRWDIDCKYSSSCFRIYPPAAETSARAFTRRRPCAPPGTIVGSMRPVQDRAETRRVLEERAREAGFDLVGVTSAEPLREGGERLREWQGAGGGAPMGYKHKPGGVLSGPRKLQKRARRG